jgi:hypothetical protein
MPAILNPHRLPAPHRTAIHCLAVFLFERAMMGLRYGFHCVNNIDHGCAAVAVNPFSRPFQAPFAVPP